MPCRLELLPRLVSSYPEQELPPEARYLLALKLLRPHLQWHAPILVLPATEQVKEMRQKERRGSEDHWRWSEALGSEDWMVGDVPAAVRETARKALAGWKQDPRGEGPKPAALGDFSWHLKDPQHPDVAEAVRLLSVIHAGDLGRQAHRWVDAIGRNNTVLTLDVTGSYGSGKAVPVVLDVRNAERVRCKLFRVRKPEDLLWVTNRIGKDFVFHDHGLQYEGMPGAERDWDRMVEYAKYGLSAYSTDKEPMPDMLKKDPIWQDESAVADLKVAKSYWWDRWREYDEDRDYRAGDGDYFHDACERYHERLSKGYRPSVGHWSSWQCNRIVEVPGKVMTEAGAYILAVEAHGQTAYAPLIVEPLSVTLRRCRDGVFVAVADTEGKQPVIGATVHGQDMLGTAVTDVEGVAFAKLYARGDRAVIVQKDGRFAVGGFGRVFEGIYLSPLERLERRDRSMKPSEGKKADAKDGQVQLYADRHVIAAYTDRPTYRPDQEVQFKVIIRRLAPDNPEKRDGPPSFRAEEFEYATRMEVPKLDTPIPFDLLDPKGRVVADGELPLNEFGTAVGKVKLSVEAAVGSYALRLRLAGIQRIVPDVCSVEYYRLPAFKLDVKGVPEKVQKPAAIRIELSGEYYFGKSLAGGRVAVRLTRSDSIRSLSDAEAVLDSTGKAVVKLEPSKDLAPGRYVVRCDLNDESGRTVSRVLPYRVEELERPRTGLGSLPRFVPQDHPLIFSTTAGIVLAEQVWRDKDGNHGRKSFRFVPQDGKATLHFPSPGWYTLTAGKDQTDVFVHGGADHPTRTLSKRQDRLLRKLDEKPDDETDDVLTANLRGWVDLTNDQAARYSNSLLDNPSAHLLALFDRQDAKVGELLRVLVYVPAKRARLLFTTEGYTVCDYFTAKTDSNRGHYHVVEIPIKRRQLPHFYLRGRILEGEEVVKPDQGKKEEGRERAEKIREDADDGTDPRSCRIDVTDPKALPHGETLRVEMKTDRADFKPGETVDVRVKVTDREGKPTAAEVSLAAVDESVYSFGEDRLSSLAAIFDDPHPAQRFYVKAWRSSIGNRWAILADRAKDSVRHDIEAMAKSMQSAKEGKEGEGRDSLRGIVRELSLPLGEMPIATVPLARLRSDFRETATWQPQLRTGADGTLRTTFKLPDSLTRYRLSAVALTKTTAIGTSRAEVRSSLPLAVQVILPRFAVEGDRLAAIGVVHNNGPRDRVCTVSWDVQGAAIDGQLEANALVGWKRDGDMGTGRLTVPAGKLVRVGLWLQFKNGGSTTVKFRCADEGDGDAEARTVAVQPLGRERSISFDGAFTDSTKVRLPLGFAARDVRVVLSRNSVARALDGIVGLIDYPYGCVEQSMSRFLPAVLVKEVARRGPLSLPPEAEAKLPVVLEQGLTRLYKFQHVDGGWGWWEHDKTDPRMTIYVVYGLARCAGAGVRVDVDVLARGSAWINAALRDGKLDVPLAARAWLALAHAGPVEVAALRQFGEQLLVKESPSEAALPHRPGLQDGRVAGRRGSTLGRGTRLAARNFRGNRPAAEGPGYLRRAARLVPPQRRPVDEIANGSRLE